MGLKYNEYLDGNKIYGCQSCKTHLADHDEILSRVSKATTHPSSPPFIPPSTIFAPLPLKRLFISATTS